jgi:transcriptional regulator with XRE-family HTH domain
MEKGWPELGKVIRKHRKAAGLTQEQLAERSDSHWTYISEIETNKVNPSIDVLRRIARGLRVPLSRMISEAEEADSA